mmetsp:Transcript_100872/g.291721  ORF Transcript_100872/g.291721 Transcript_100872/m.291721 type:complete len:363 (+) Transcript_100872:741-1829(+)
MAVEHHHLALLLAITTSDGCVVQGPTPERLAAGDRGEMRGIVVGRLCFAPQCALALLTEERPRDLRARGGSSGNVAEVRVVDRHAIKDQHVAAARIAREARRRHARIRPSSGHGALEGPPRGRVQLPLNARGNDEAAVRKVHEGGAVLHAVRVRAEPLHPILAHHVRRSQHPVHACEDPHHARDAGRVLEDPPRHKPRSFAIVAGFDLRVLQIASKNGEAIHTIWIHTAALPIEIGVNHPPRSVVGRHEGHRIPELTTWRFDGVHLVPHPRRAANEAHVVHGVGQLRVVRPRGDRLAQLVVHDGTKCRPGCPPVALGSVASGVWRVPLQRVVAETPVGVGVALPRSAEVVVGVIAENVGGAP